MQLDERNIIKRNECNIDTNKSEGNAFHDSFVNDGIIVQQSQIVDMVHVWVNIECD